MVARRTSLLKDPRAPMTEIWYVLIMEKTAALFIHRLANTHRAVDVAQW